MCDYKTTLVDSIGACKDATASLCEEAIIAVDIEGVEDLWNGTIDLLQIAASSSGDVYLFDIQTLGKDAFGDEGGLKKLLENPASLKVVYNGEAAAVALSKRYVSLHKTFVWDLEVPHTYSLSFWQDDHFLNIMDTVAKHANSPGDSLDTAAENEMTGIKINAKKLFAPEFGGSAKAWQARPLSEDLIQYASCKVKCLLEVAMTWRDAGDWSEVGIDVEAISRLRFENRLNEYGRSSGKGMRKYRPTSWGMHLQDFN